MLLLQGSEGVQRSQNSNHFNFFPKLDPGGGIKSQFFPKSKMVHIILRGRRVKRVMDFFHIFWTFFIAFLNISGKEGHHCTVRLYNEETTTSSPQTDYFINCWESHINGVSMVLKLTIFLYLGPTSKSTWTKKRNSKESTLSRSLENCHF